MAPKEGHLSQHVTSRAPAGPGPVAGGGSITPQANRMQPAPTETAAGRCRQADAGAAFAVPSFAIGPPTPPAITLHRMSLEDDLHGFLEVLEATERECQWLKKEWALLLHPLLTQDVQAVASFSDSTATVLDRMDSPPRNAATASFV